MGMEFTNAWEDNLLWLVREARRLENMGRFTKAKDVLEEARVMLSDPCDISPTVEGDNTKNKESK